MLLFFSLHICIYKYDWNNFVNNSEKTMYIVFKNMLSPGINIFSRYFALKTISFGAKLIQDLNSYHFSRENWRNKIG